MALGGSHLGARAEVAASRVSKRSQTAGERGFAALQVVIGVALALGLFAVLLPGIQGALSESLGCVSQRLAQALGGETGSADSCGSARVMVAAAGGVEMSWRDAGRSGAWHAFAQRTGTARATPLPSVRVAQADVTPRGESSTLEQEALKVIRVRVSSANPQLGRLPQTLPEAELRELLAKSIVQYYATQRDESTITHATEEAARALLRLPNHVLAYAPKRIILARNVTEVPGFERIEKVLGGDLLGAYDASRDEAVVGTSPRPGWARSGRAPQWWWRARYALSLERHVLLHEVGHAMEQILRQLAGPHIKRFRDALRTDLYNPNPAPLDARDYDYRRPEVLAYFDQESWEEAFSESFAWYHTDPQALQRTWPNLFRYWADNPIERALRDMRR